MLKRVRLNSQFLFVCWAKVKGKTRSKRTRRKELIVRRSFTFGIHSVFDNRQKKIKNLLRDLSQAKFLYFCAQNISFLPAAHTGLPHFGREFLRYSIVDVVILIRRRKSRRKGPERERERVYKARSKSGEVVAYPVVETVHEDNICDTTFAPAMISNKMAEKAQAVAKSAIASFEGAGIFGVELFLLEDGETVLLNECAPRPHNSGHYTIEACNCSQYEMHLRAICGWPLGNPQLKVGGSVMKNILGDGDGEKAMTKCHRIMGKALTVPGASVHWYEKPEVKKARKVGHITTVGASLNEAKERMSEITGDDYNVQPSIGIIMGSDSDLPTMAAAADVLKDFGIKCEVTVISAHRTPQEMFDYSKKAHTRGIRAIIAGAGGAAHLPGMVAAMTPLPVIGVPVPLKYLDGMDSLLSIVQMPKGVPTATVAIGNAANAGLLAARIVGAYEPEVLKKMEEYQDNMTEVVLGKADKLMTNGYEKYLKEM